MPKTSKTPNAGKLNAYYMLRGYFMALNTPQPILHALNTLYDPANKENSDGK